MREESKGAQSCFLPLLCLCLCLTFLAGNCSWITSANQIQTEDSFPSFSLSLFIPLPSLSWEAVTFVIMHLLCPPTGKKGKKNTTQSNRHTTLMHKHTDRTGDRRQDTAGTRTGQGTLTGVLPELFILLTLTSTQSDMCTGQGTGRLTASKPIILGKDQRAHHTRLQNIHSLCRESLFLLFTLPLLWIPNQQYYICPLPQSPILSTTYIKRNASSCPSCVSMLLYSYFPHSSHHTHAVP